MLERFERCDEYRCGWCVCSDVLDDECDVHCALFSVDVCKADAAVREGCENDGVWRVFVVTHFVEGDGFEWCLDVTTLLVSQ